MTGRVEERFNERVRTAMNYEPKTPSVTPYRRISPIHFQLRSLAPLAKKGFKLK